MNWWGKVAGGAFGFLIGGPLGALFGAAIGHHFDRGLAEFAPADTAEPPPVAEQERIQAAFFTATFAVMGHVAKADGRISADEIALARAVMQQMRLDDAQTRFARDLFSQGKQDDFDLDGVLAQFKHECRRRHNLLQMFLEIQLQAAYADGALHPRESARLLHIAATLGFSRAQFAALDQLVGAERSFAGGATGACTPRQGPPRRALDDAYAMLGVSSNASDDEVKKAFRRLMSQHHPDKLVSKGLPEEMLKIATAKTQDIKRAYDLIKATRVKR